MKINGFRQREIQEIQVKDLGHVSFSFSEAILAKKQL
jgi:hypothetical protein